MSEQLKEKEGGTLVIDWDYARHLILDSRRTTIAREKDMNEQLQRVEKFIERQESVASGYITWALQRELQAICNDRLRPGRKVIFRHVMGLLDVKISTNKRTHTFEPWGSPTTSRYFTIGRYPEPASELGKKIGQLLYDYTILTDHRKFAANEFEFITGW